MYTHPKSSDAGTPKDARLRKDRSMENTISHVVDVELGQTAHTETE